MNKQRIILVSGRQNSGKSNIIAFLYLKLLQIQPNHIFNWDINTKSISQIQIPLIDDFFCVFEPINGVRVGLISNSDFHLHFKDVFNHIRKNIDVLICTSRSVDNENSVYRYITADLLNEGVRIDLNFVTFPTHKNENVRREMQDTIVDTIMYRLNNIYFNNQISK